MCVFRLSAAIGLQCVHVIWLISRVHDWGLFWSETLNYYGVDKGHILLAFAISAASLCVLPFLQASHERTLLCIAIALGVLVVPPLEIIWHPHFTGRSNLANEALRMVIQSVAVAALAGWSGIRLQRALLRPNDSPPESLGD